METWPEVAQKSLLGKYMGFQPLEIFMSCFEKTGIKKKKSRVCARSCPPLATRRAVPARLLCMALPGKNVGVAAILLQDLPTQGANLCHLHCKQTLSLEPPGKPMCFAFESWCKRRI